MYMNICTQDSDIRYGQAVSVDLLSTQKQNPVAQLSIWIHG